MVKMAEGKKNPLKRPAKVAKAIARKRVSYAVAFLMVFFVTFSVLYQLDLDPEPVRDQNVAAIDLRPEVTLAGVVASAGATVIETAATASVETVEAGELPMRIVIPDAGVDVKVGNPARTDIKTLDFALLSGAVRYPTSAKLGEEGNVVIFGHSSYLPVVRNENFKAFNGIQNLSAGDSIIVTSKGTTYRYAVESVREVKASEGVIPLTVSGKKLTLATCNSFGTPQDRFVVTATLVESAPLGS